MIFVDGGNDRVYVGEGATVGISEFNVAGTIQSWDAGASGGTFAGTNVPYYNYMKMNKDTGMDFLTQGRNFYENDESLFTFDSQDAFTQGDILRMSNAGIRALTIDYLGNMKIDGDLDVDGNITGNTFYGSVCYHNHTATPLSFDTQYKFYNLTFNSTHDDDAIFNGVRSEGTQYLIIDKGGIYHYDYSGIGSGENNVEYVTGIKVNNTIQDCTTVHKKMSAGGDITTQVNGGIIRLATGSKVSVGTADWTGTSNGNYYGMGLSLNYISK